jgi:hypothetical protein
VFGTLKLCGLEYLFEMGCLYKSCKDASDTHVLYSYSDFVRLNDFETIVNM